MIVAFFISHCTQTSAASGLLRVVISIQGIARKARLSISGSDTIHLCWSPEVGKSSLKHLLVHNTPKAVTTSTAVMDTPEVVRSEQYTVGESTSAWQLADSEIMRKSLHALQVKHTKRRISTLLKWKPKRLKMGSMKLLWRSK